MCSVRFDLARYAGGGPQRCRTTLSLPDRMGSVAMVVTARPLQRRDAEDDDPSVAGSFNGSVDSDESCHSVRRAGAVISRDLPRSPVLTGGRRDLP